MFYVTTFDSDPTKSFTNVAYNNIKALQTQKINFELRPLNYILNWSNKPSWFLDEDRDYFTKTTASSTPSALVHLQISDLLKVPYTSKQDSVGMTAIEASGVPPWICEGLNESYRGLIVPSDHCKSCLEASGLRIPIRVVKHALPEMWLKDYPAPQSKPKAYTFGFVGNWNSRKNPETVLHAYLAAFPEPQEDIALVLKTFNAGDIEGYIQKKCGVPRTDIWVYDESFSEMQMLWLFQMIDCYVSPHRGEAFGLALAQNAALGKPSLYTGYSAPIEWLSPPHVEIPHTLCKVSESLTQSDFKFEHVKDMTIEWADVKIDDLAHQMKAAAGSNLRTGFTGQALSAFRESLSWSKIGSDLVWALEDILDRQLERIN